MHELDHHPENESHYSCDDCNDSGIHNETREYCACRLGLARCNSDAFAEMLRGSPFTDAMWAMHQSTVKTAKAIAAAELALLKSKLLQAERRAAQPVVLSDDRILDIADSEGISFVTDERRPDNATIISFARAILAAKEQA